MKKGIKEIVFSVVVVMLLTVIGYQYELSKKKDVSYTELHKISTEVLVDSKENSAMVNVMRDDLLVCYATGDTLRLALGNTDELLKKMTDAYKKKEHEVMVFDKAHDNLWEQYLALQADYNAYMDYINSGEDKQKLLAGIEACVADQKSIRNDYDKLAITYNQLYEYSDSIYAYSNAVYRDYHRLDSAYNILFDEYEVLYNEYLNDGAEIVSNE